jgi:hypothetical protein
MVHTDIPEAPWFVVESDDKKAARLDMMSHLLSTIPYVDRMPAPMKLPKRPAPKGYERPPREHTTYVPDHTSTLLSGRDG